MIKNSLVALASAAGLSACTPQGPEPARTAETIYHGGDFVTMDATQPTAEAVAVKDGKILAVGPHLDVEGEHKGATTRMVDLGGKTLLPGFIDAHGHLKNVGFQALSADLLPPPDGEVDSIGDLQKNLRAWSEGTTSEDLGWIVGFGYDDAQLEERRHPNRDDLDAVSQPSFLYSSSISPGICTPQTASSWSSRTSDAATEDPPGGAIRRRSDSREPNGVLEETALALILACVAEAHRSSIR